MTRLLNVMNLSDRDLFTTGDGGNDLAMLKMAKKSFTAITRPDDIKGQVDHVIDPTKEGLLTPIN